VKTLSVTEASRSFSDCVKRVYVRKESFAIIKLGVPWALLVPAPARVCTSHELADDLASPSLSSEDRRNFAAALRKGRKALKPLRNPWG
jgi:hypothetical protein